jgi:hypothetical protein
MWIGNPAYHVGRRRGAFMSIKGMQPMAYGRGRCQTLAIINEVFMRSLLIMAFIFSGTYAIAVQEDYFDK